jgi:hypothetical protein
MTLQGCLRRPAAFQDGRDPMFNPVIRPARIDEYDEVTRDRMDRMDSRSERIRSNQQLAAGEHAREEARRRARMKQASR